MDNNFAARFEKYIEANELVAPGESVLLAVSGGVDSMAMLSLFARSGRQVGVAHCNFQLRGDEAMEDEAMVEREAARFGAPFYNMRFDTRGEMERTGESVQMAARRLRYDWFGQLCDEHGYAAVSIAHHADDSIETFFINLLRGTGLRGLTGIGVTRGRVIRPLLFASRKEILEYAHSNGIAFREDSSNRSTKYLRNKIRLGLVPRIREINPRFTEVMGQNVQHLTDAQMFIGHAVENIRRTVEERRGPDTVIRVGRIEEGFPQNYVIYELLTKYGFKGDVVDALCRSLGEGTSGRRFYARDHVARTDRGDIVISPIMDDDLCEMSIAADTHKIYCGNSVMLIEHIDIDDLDGFAVPANVALLDSDKLQFPLEVRRWQPGDSFVPFGMSGRKKVSDFLVDAKVPAAEKQRQFVVVSGGEIAWLAGRRIDERYRIGSATENILRITTEVI